MKSAFPVRQLEISCIERVEIWIDWEGLDYIARFRDVTVWTEVILWWIYEKERKSKDFARSSLSLDRSWCLCELLRSTIGKSFCCLSHSSNLWRQIQWCQRHDKSIRTKVCVECQADRSRSAMHRGEWRALWPHIPCPILIPHYNRKFVLKQTIN